MNLPDYRPDNFYQCVIKEHQAFNSIHRINDPGLLEPVTRQKVHTIIGRAREQGLMLVIFETYRSQERQQVLFNQGVTQLKKVGVHHFGLACDLVKIINGKLSWEGDFSLLGELALAEGLIWGGDWGTPHLPNNFVDAVHVQRCAVAHQPLLFEGTWYPDERYTPYFIK
jgi:hypothetical protein